MGKYRHTLGQVMDRMFLTDGGLETTLIFHEQRDLPAFAAFDLLKSADGIETLRRYFSRYAELARAQRVGLVLESPTWRANPEWAAGLGYDADTLARANRQAIELMQEVRERYESAEAPMVISGNIGPRGDGYNPSRRMTTAQARDYHLPQVQVFAASAADLVSAFTMNYVEEAIGVVLAARGEAMPVVISFTVETDGRLPSGETLAAAIRRTDQETDGYPVYYMINCAHPTHFADTLGAGKDWQVRIGGVRANASRRSHAELDASPDLDAGDPEELGQLHRVLKAQVPSMRVFGGCCGTDHRHVEAICLAVGPGQERGRSVAA